MRCLALATVQSKDLKQAKKLSKMENFAEKVDEGGT